MKHQTETTPPPVSQPSLPETATITLTATGDILMHNTEIRSGLQPDGTYSFDFFNDVKSLIAKGDYASACLETPLAGPKSGYTGYPLFNSPDAVADSLKSAGYDFIAAANNHILDRGYQGALRTLDVFKEAGLDSTGFFKSSKERASFLIKDLKGINVGYLSYTYGTNGNRLPKGSPYIVNLIDREQILRDISLLRPKVDVLVLVLHWGTEYEQQPSQQQKKLAEDFLNAGADVILGSHPHVIQPMETIKVNGKDKFVIYSMGNFISDQNGLLRNSGIILNLTFTKNIKTNETLLKEVSYIPTYSFSYFKNGKKKFKVVSVQDAISNIENGSIDFLSQKDLPKLKSVLEQTTAQLGEGFLAHN